MNPPTPTPETSPTSPPTTGHAAQAEDPTVAFRPAGPLPERSLALEASAGTGKTWTLTSLAVRYLAERDVELPELLLVTFTRAATAELRERVRTRIAETLAAIEQASADPLWSSDDPVLDHIVGQPARAGDRAELDARRDRLRQAAAQLDDATISTIHGFCQRMLQHAALEAGVDFDAVLLDDDADLLAELVDDLIARELRPASPDWVRYLQQVAGVDRDRLTALAREVTALPSLQLWPPAPPDGEPDQRPWDRALADLRSAWTQGGRQRAIDHVADLQDAGVFAKPRQRTYTRARAETEAAKVDAWLAADQDLPPGPVPTKDLHKAGDYPFAYFTSAALAPHLAAGAPTPAFPPVWEAAQRLLAAASEPATRFLRRAARYLWDELDRRKRERTVLTFDDLLRRLADALASEDTRDAVRAAIRQRYRVALIDEFQDTDAIQWRIFRALFADDEPFVLIGDPKQAIYAFRGADIHTYVQARDSRDDHRTLGTNRRSDRSYVAACNALFGQPDSFGTSDIPYHRVAAHHGDRLDDPRGGTALQLRYVHRDAGSVATGGSGKGLLTKGWADRALPGDVAAVAADLLSSGATIDADEGGPPRSIEPRDLAVLVRTNRRATAAQQALRDAGIPAVIQRGGSVFVTDEADALQRLLAALLRPSAERPAVVAAASLLFGRDAPTLVAQRDALDRQAAGATRAPDIDPATEVPAVPASGDPDSTPDLPARAAEWDRWIDHLTRWSDRWHTHGVMAAIRQAFAEDGVPERLLATPDGDRRLTNLRHLLELLHEVESLEDLRPTALLDWLRTQRRDAADGDLPSSDSELRLEEDAQAVRVVTVHGSKGLQYPVVLCPDLWDGKLRVDRDLTRFHDPDASDPAAAITLDLDVDPTTDGKRRSIDLATDEQRTEQLRLAYVALTRAQHRCVVWWGAFNDAPTSALASLLHGTPASDGARSRLARGQERVESASDDDLIADLQRFADTTDGAIGVHVLDELRRGATWASEPTDAGELAARPFDRGDVDRSWRRTSFTGLIRDASDQGRLAVEVVDPTDGRDVDGNVELAGATRGSGGVLPPDGVPDAAALEEVPLARFPRGAAPGTFLHDVLEQADLTAMHDPAGMDPLLEQLERRHGIDPVHRPDVARGLAAAADTPLGAAAGGAKLADLARGDRLDELRFELPLAGGHDARGAAVTLGALADLLDDADEPLLRAYAPRLRDPAIAREVRGYLNGSIDLLARLPDGRFLVADYKSNWLGDRDTDRSVVTDYHPQALAAAMREHHYVLQALLYLVAAHRYLRWRVDGFNHDRHVVGAGYLFLRGMVGPDTPVVDGQPCGTTILRPGGDLVAAISRLLDGGRP